MELLLLVCVIGIVWALLAHVKKDGGRDKNQRGRGHKEYRSPANVSGRKRKEKLKLQEQLLPARRPDVLSALREGKLSQGQISQIFENASYFKFSPEELAEFQKALTRTKKSRATGSYQPCRVCGRPSIPGEDLCYTHHAK